MLTVHWWPGLVGVGGLLSEHWFFGGKGLGVQQGMSVWVGSSKCEDPIHWQREGARARIRVMRMVPRLCWLLNLEWWSYFDHANPVSSKTHVICGPVLEAIPNHILLKYRCRSKKSNQIRDLVYLGSVNILFPMFFNFILWFWFGFWESLTHTVTFASHATSFYIRSLICVDLSSK